MKQIIAIVKPFIAEQVIRAVAELPYVELTAHEAKGFGRQKNYLDLYRTNEFSLMFVAKVEISLIVEDELVEAAIEKITTAARTGRLGDGKIMVLPVLGTPLQINENESDGQELSAPQVDHATASEEPASGDSR
ncbi:MAG: P-II family nitrogen regulator [Pirellulaceae bacterium]|nr:P-II family nitrogen regulator [Pirellulaceae bacterium]